MKVVLDRLGFYKVKMLHSFLLQLLVQQRRSGNPTLIFPVNSNLPPLRTLLSGEVLILGLATLSLGLGSLRT